MAEHPASESSSDNFWPEPSKMRKAHLFPSKKVEDLASFLHPLDEAPDFHDPYSDLSLFLSKKIKEEYQACGLIKKWSIYLQEKLIAKITPEFKKKFPNYKLGVNALHKTWKKIVYYSEQIQSQKDALTREGKLNISFLIKENLKQYLKLKSGSDFYPYQYAYQLAMKISDCVATLDGTRPLLDHLAKTIWFAQKHLLCATTIQKMRSPHDEIDKWDKLIIKILLEIIEKNPEASHKELEIGVKESLGMLQELPSQAHISALLAEKLYPTSSFHTLYGTEQKTAIFSFISKHLMLYKKASIAFNLSECVRRVMAFYTLASKLPKNLIKEQIGTSHLDQSLLAFFSQEARLLPGSESLYESYAETQNLPELHADHLEMIVWKVLSKEEALFDKLPYKIGQKIEEEIAGIIIDNPKLNFTSIAGMTVHFFKRAKELSESKKWEGLEKKISLWTSQGDLLCRWLHLDPESALLKLICEFKQKRPEPLSHVTFISEVTQIYLRDHPAQTPYAPQVAARLSILYKYAWYALFSSPEESSLDRFLEWHFTKLGPLEEGVMMYQIEEICKKKAPLIPFDKEHCLMLFRRRQKIETENNKRQA